MALVPRWRRQRRFLAALLRRWRSWGSGGRGDRSPMQVAPSSFGGINIRDKICATGPPFGYGRNRFIDFKRACAKVDLAAISVMVNSNQLKNRGSAVRPCVISSIWNSCPALLRKHTPPPPTRPRPTRPNPPRCSGASYGCFVVPINATCYHGRISDGRRLRHSLFKMGILVLVNLGMLAMRLTGKVIPGGPPRCASAACGGTQAPFRPSITYLSIYYGVDAAFRKKYAPTYYHAPEITQYV